MFYFLRTIKWLATCGPTSGGDATFFATGVDILTQWIEFKRQTPCFLTPSKILKYANHLI